MIQSTGPADQATQVGWAQVLTSGSVSAFAVFTQAGGPRLQEAVVPLENRTPGAFILSFDGTSNFATGVALANVANKSANVGVVIRDDTGTVFFTSSIALPALGHTSFDLAANYPIAATSRYGGVRHATQRPNQRPGSPLQPDVRV